MIHDESANTPLLPHPSTSKATKASNRYKMIAGLVLGVVIILGVGVVSYNRVNGSDPTDESSGSAAWPTFIGFEGPTPSELLHLRQSYLPSVWTDRAFDGIISSAGAEPLAVATAYPSNHDTSPLRPPPNPKGASKKVGRVHSKL